MGHLLFWILPEYRQETQEWQAFYKKTQKAEYPVCEKLDIPLS